MDRKIIYSSFWLRHSKECTGFGDLKYNKPWHKITNWFCIRSYLKSLENSALIFGLLPQAKSVCKKLKTHFTYDCFRQVCSLAAVLKYNNFPREILIVGDGFGFLSCLCNRIFTDSRIVLVDIPEILEIQKKVVSAEFYTPDRIDEINGNFDVIINISSMQEMTVKMVDEYFRLFRRVISQDGLFYCCNRVKKKLYDGEVLEFFKYPWKKNDKILIDEEPSFYKYSYYCLPPFKRSFDGAMWHRLTKLEKLNEKKEWFNSKKTEKIDSAHIPRSSAAGITIAGMKPYLDTPMLCIGEFRRLHLPYIDMGARLGLGTVWMGRHWPENKPYAKPNLSEIENYLINAFKYIGNDKGLVTLDTAASYGLSEERIGEFLEARPDLKSRAFIATKWGEEMPTKLGERGKTDFSVDHLRLSVERSIKRLKNNKINLLYIHSASLDVLRDEAVKNAMTEMKENKTHKIQYIGATISKEETLEQAVNEGSINWLDSIQIPIGLYTVRDDLVQSIYEKGIAIVLNSVVRKGPNQDPGKIFERLFQDERLAMILTGTRNHLLDTIGYLHKYYAQKKENNFLGNVYGN